MLSEESNKTNLRRMYVELFNQQKLSLAEELFTADFIDHGIPPGMPNRGPASAQQVVTMFHDAFPDIAFQIEEMIAEGETVAARVSWSGTHRGDWVGIAPTGRVVHQEQMHFMHFRDGKMIEHLAVRDDLGLRQQLGVLPDPTHTS